VEVFDASSVYHMSMKLTLSLRMFIIAIFAIKCDTITQFTNYAVTWLSFGGRYRSYGSPNWGLWPASSPQATFV